MLRRNYLRMERKRDKLMLNILFGMSLLVFCYSLGSTISRYYSTGGFSPTIGVAKWQNSVDDTLSNQTIHLVCGGSGENYTFSVESESEVATNYQIILTNLPSDVEVSLDGGNYLSPVSGTITYQNAGTFGVSDIQREHTHTLSFKAPLSANTVSGDSVSVQVAFSQVI